MVRKKTSFDIWQHLQQSSFSKIWIYDIVDGERRRHVTGETIGCKAINHRLKRGEKNPIADRSWQIGWRHDGHVSVVVGVARTLTDGVAFLYVSAIVFSPKTNIIHSIIPWPQFRWIQSAAIPFHEIISRLTGRLVQSMALSVPVFIAMAVILSNCCNLSLEMRDFSRCQWQISVGFETPNSKIETMPRNWIQVKLNESTATEQ